jgi:hypothetical protein
LYDTELDFEFELVDSAGDHGRNIDLVLPGGRGGQNVFD